MATTTITSNTVSYPSGKYHVIIDVNNVPTAESFDVLLNTIGSLTFGHGQSDPYLMYPDSLSIELAVVDDMDTVIYLQSLFRLYPCTVHLFRDDSELLEYFLGTVDPKSVVIARNPVLKFDALNEILDWKKDIDPADSTGAPLKIYDIVHSNMLQYYFTQIHVDYQLTKNDLGTPTAMSVFDAYIKDELLFHTRTPFKTYGDSYKALLQSLSCFLMCAPFRIAHLIPIVYNGSTDILTLKIKDILDYSFDPQPFAPLDLYSRVCSEVSYAGETYNNGQSCLRITVSGITIPPVPFQTIYRYTNIFGTTDYIVRAVNLSSGSGTIDLQFLRGLGGSGTLNKLFGPGDATIVPSASAFITVDVDENGSRNYVLFPCNADDKHTGYTTSLFANVSFNLDIYSFSALQKNRSGYYDMLFGDNFKSIQSRNYNTLYLTTGITHSLKIKGTEHPVYKFINYQNAYPFSRFFGKVFRCLKYKIDIKSNTTALELIEV